MTVSQDQKDEWLRESQLKDYPYRIASEDWVVGLAAARRIADPAERCTALAWVAYFSPDDHVVPLVSEAMAALGEGMALPVQTGCAGYPLRALIERGKLEQACQLSDQVLADCEAIADRVSRSRALRFVLEALLPGESRTWRAAFDALRRACIPVDDWQQGYDLYRAVLLVAGMDRELAESVIADAPPSHHRRSLENKLRRNEFDRTHSFFWALPRGLTGAAAIKGDELDDPA